LAQPNREDGARRTLGIQGTVLIAHMSSRSGQAIACEAAHCALPSLVARIDSRFHLSYSVGEMAAAPSLAQFEQLVLTAILALDEDAYGVSIHAKVAELAAPKAISLGAVYVTLDRLEDKAFTVSWLSEPTPERGGRAKRCYKLEALGERALQDAAATIRRMHEALNGARGKRRWKPVRVR
jgi:PadR family transcriptional regulator PadR